MTGRFRCWFSFNTDQVIIVFQVAWLKIRPYFGLVRHAADRWGSPIFVVPLLAKGKRDSDQTWLQLFGSGQVFSYVPKIIKNVKKIYIYWNVLRDDSLKMHQETAQPWYPWLQEMQQPDIEETDLKRFRFLIIIFMEENKSKFLLCTCLPIWGDMTA